jgi:hypothetical protein
MDADRRLRSPKCLNHHPDHEGSEVLRNAGQYPPDFTARHPRKQTISTPLVRISYLTSWWDVRQFIHWFKTFLIFINNNGKWKDEMIVYSV